jgi:hypothetical protein
MITTWRELFAEALEWANETWEDIESSTLTDTQLDTRFNNDYGGEMGSPFTVWTFQRVYFPCIYDGRQWVGSVVRHPNGKPTQHIGSG